MKSSSDGFARGDRGVKVHLDTCRYFIKIDVYEKGHFDPVECTEVQQTTIDSTASVQLSLAATTTLF